MPDTQVLLKYIPRRLLSRLGGISETPKKIHPPQPFLDRSYDFSHQYGRHALCLLRQFRHIPLAHCRIASIQRPSKTILNHRSHHVRCHQSIDAMKKKLGQKRYSLSVVPLVVLLRGRKCELSTGQPSTEPHRDHRVRAHSNVRVSGKSLTDVQAGSPLRGLL